MGKKKSFFIVIFLLTSGCLKNPQAGKINPGQREKIYLFSGIITKNTVWDGIIQIDDDLLIPKGVKLIIQPGTKIKIKEKDSSKNEPLFLSPYNEILIRGKIIARGEVNNPIIFYGEGKSMDGIFWAGIILDQAEDGIFNFCKIQNAFTGIDSLKSSPVIEENIFEKNKYAFVSSGEISYPKIAKNVIRENYAGFYGIFSSRGELTGNWIENNEEEGIFIGIKSNLILKGNNFSGNKYDVRQE
ncbi:MAG: right-handed parallel beta-helix repeat-containing protein [bacterium]